MRRRFVPLFLAAAAMAAAACAQNARAHRYEAPGVQLILPDEIARSGAETAWDVVRRLSHMTTATTTSGEPSRAYRRGRSSILIRETPVVVVDGAQATDISILATIRADQIAWMRVLTGTASSTQFGAQGGAGAVIVATLRGDDSPGISRTH